MGGIPFTRGPLAYLLRNCFYIGEVAFKGEVLKGEQPAIVDRALFDAVQAKLNEQATNHKTIRMQSEALLAGRIFDDRGNRMSPTHVRKGGIKYRYYLSSALLRGAAERAGSVRRACRVRSEAPAATSTIVPPSLARIVAGADFGRLPAAGNVEQMPSMDDRERPRPLLKP